MHSSLTFLQHKISIIRAITLLMEAASISETSVNFYQTTRPKSPEDSRLQNIT
jgi:hypothetical protein